jgi:di/tricarboxylate transporter
MNQDLIIVLALLAAAIFLFMRNAIRMDAVALLVLVALSLTGILNTDEVLAGFSDPAVVLIAGLFVVGESLARTGVAQRLGDWLIARAGKTEGRLIPLLMTTVAGIGSVMSSTAVVAIFLPVVLRITRNTGISPARLMMPLSVAALISGMMTLVATAPNLVVNAELIRHGFKGFHFFSFTPFGMAVLVIGVTHMLVARRLLRSKTGEDKGEARPHLSDWVQEYGLTQREARLRIPYDSPLVGKTLQRLELRSSAGVNVVAIERPSRFRHRVIKPAATTELMAGDILFLDLFAPTIDIDEIRTRFKLEALPLTGAYFLDHSQELGMAEGMIPASSELIDKTVTGYGFRSSYDLTVIGLRRGGVPFQGSVIHEKLKLGDTLLMIGPWRAIRRLQAKWKDIVLLNLPAEIDDVLPAASRAPHALGVVLLMIALMVSGVVPNVIAVIAACLLMGFFRCIDFDSAYRSIHWQSLVLIVGMMPFALALQKTGGIDLAAEALLSVVGMQSPHFALGILFLVTVALGLFISNTATAVLMAPVAIAMARDMDASPYPFAMSVALASSAAFITPVSSPVNTLVVGPGGYTFSDFFRVGTPMALLTMLATILLVPLVFPLHP